MRREDDDALIDQVDSGAKQAIWNLSALVVLAGIIWLIVGVAILTDVRGWARAGLEVVWALNVLVASRLAWRYRISHRRP